MIRGLKKLSDNKPITQKQPPQIQKAGAGRAPANQYGARGLREDDFDDEEFSDGDFGGQMGYANQAYGRGKPGMGGMDYDDMGFDDEFDDDMEPGNSYLEDDDDFENQEQNYYAGGKNPGMGVFNKAGMGGTGGPNRMMSAQQGRGTGQMNRNPVYPGHGFDDEEDDDDDDDIFGNVKQINANKQGGAAVAFGSDDDDDEDEDDDDLFDIEAMKKKTKKDIDKAREEEAREAELKKQKEEEEARRKIQEIEDKKRKEEERIKTERDLQEQKRNEQMKKQREEENKKKQAQKASLEPSKKESSFGDFLDGISGKPGDNKNSSGISSNLFKDDSKGRSVSGFNKMSENDSLSALNAPLGDDSENQSKALDQSMDDLLGGGSNDDSEDMLKRAANRDEDDEDDEIDSAEFDPNYQPKPTKDEKQKKPDALKNSNFSFKPKDSTTFLHNSNHQGQQPFLGNNTQQSLGLPPNYQSVAAQEYANMAMMEEERQRALQYLNETNYDKDKVINLQKMNELKNLEKIRLEKQLEFNLKSKQDIEKELKVLAEKCEIYKIENEQLIQSLDLKEMRIDELILANRALEQESAQKSRLLKERQEFTQKSYLNNALDSQKRLYETELESGKIKITMLQEALKAAEEKLQIYEVQAGPLDNFGDNFDQKNSKTYSAFQGKGQNDQIIKSDLQAQINSLKGQLELRDIMKKRESSDDQTEKELLISELLIKGLSKENERLIAENRGLKSNMNGLQEQIQSDHKKTLQSKSRFGNTAGSLGPDLEQEYKDSISRLQDELLKKDVFYRDKLKNLESIADELESQKKQLQALESAQKDKIQTLGEKDQMLHAANTELKNHVKDYKELTQKYQSLKQEFEAQRNDLSTKNKENSKLRSDLASLNEKLESAKQRAEKKERELEKRIKDLEKAKAAQVQLAKQKSEPQPSSKAGNSFSLKNKTINQTKNVFGKRPQKLSTQNSEEIELNPIILDDVFEGKNLINNRDTMFGDTANDFRKSVMRETGNLLYDKKRHMIKSVIQNLKQGDPIQRLNDLVDNIVIHFSKGREEVVREIIEDLEKFKDDLENFYDVGDFFDRLAELQEAINFGDGDQQKTMLVSQVEKKFVDDMFNMLPDYLDRNSFGQQQKHLQQGSVPKNNFLGQNVEFQVEGSSKEPLNGESRLNLERLRRDNDGLRIEVQLLSQEKSKLERIIKENPKSVRDVDFAVLERKIDIIEKNQKIKALDIQQTLQEYLQKTDPEFTKGQGTHSQRPTEEQWLKEREKLVQIIKSKNREISNFRHELDKMILEVVELKNKKK